MKIETERLILRTIVKEDANDIYEYSKDPEVGPKAGWKPHDSIEETEEIMEMIFIEKEGVFGIVEKASGKMIGSIGLIEDPKRENPHARMIGYALGKSAWGKGYMTEAAKALIAHGFQVMKLELISAYCYPVNLGSKRVLEKCGFAYEGTLQKCELRYDQVLLDNECFSLINPQVAS